MKAGASLPVHPTVSVQQLAPPVEAVREKIQRHCRPAPNGKTGVLDVDAANVYDFEQGSARLLWRDLEQIAPEFQGEHDWLAYNLRRCSVDKAFRVRRELINFKKVLLHANNRAAELERRLRRSCTVLHTPLSDVGAACHRDYVDLSKCLSTMRGLRTGLREARNLTKRICQHHRHPDRTAAEVQSLQKSHVFSAAPHAEFVARSGVLKKLNHAQAFLEGRTAAAVRAGRSGARPTDGAPAAQGARSEGKGGSAVRVDGSPGFPPEHLTSAAAAARWTPTLQHQCLWAQFEQLLAGDAAVAVAPAAACLSAHPTTSDYDRDGGSSAGSSARAPAYNCEVVGFGKRIIVARGGAKALQVWANLQTFASFLRQNIDRATGLLARLEAVQPDCSQPAAGKGGQGGVDTAGSSCGSDTAPLKRPRTTASAAVSAEADAETDAAAGALTRESVTCARLSLVLQGCVEAMTAVWGGCEKILALPAGNAPARAEEDGGTVLFRCGDLDPRLGHRLIVPDDFAAFDRLAELEAKWRRCEPSVRAALAKTGWPPRPLSVHSSSGSTSTSLGRSSELATVVAGTIVCRGACGGAFSSLWVHNGKCCMCEQDDRQRGVCPFQASRMCKRWHQQRQGGHPESGGQDVQGHTRANWLWCPHESRCLSCDLGASCSRCRFWRMDGDDVLRLAEVLGKGRLGLVCVDFDQTFCTTKNGGVPVVGVHALDPGLLALYRWCQPPVYRASPVSEEATGGARPWDNASVASDHKNGGAASPAPAPLFRVVTRNSNQQAIEAFLRAHGVDAEVLCVKKLAEAEAQARREGAAWESVREGAAHASPPAGGQKLSKADVVLRLVRESVAAPGTDGVALFIDDTLEELASQGALCAHQGIYRVLFCKSS